MRSVLGELLPLALGVAVSPLPVIAVLLILLGPRARTSSIGLAAGWLAGVVVATGVFVIVGRSFLAPDDHAHSASPMLGWIKLFLGTVLLGAGIRELLSHKTSSATEPRWMATVDTLNPLAAAGVGFALMAINIKNIALCAAAGITIGSAGLRISGATGCVAMFSLLAATTVIVPVIGSHLAADLLRQPLSHAQQWLQVNHDVVIAVLLVLLGTVLIGTGIAAI